MLSAVVIEPKNLKNEAIQAQSTVIWLHGLGATGHDFEPLVPHLGLPNVRFVFPHAPERRVTMQGGYSMPAWYDILSVDFHAEAPREDHQHVAAMVGEIHALIAHEMQMGIPAASIVLAGFSQGAAMALAAGLRYPVELAGVACLSGYLISPFLPADLKGCTTPILVAHGLEDPVVPCALGERAQRTLCERGVETVDWKTYSMGHEVCPQEIADIARWLKRCLPNTATPAAIGVDRAEG